MSVSSQMGLTAGPLFTAFALTGPSVMGANPNHSALRPAAELSVPRVSVWENFSSLARCARDVASVERVVNQEFLAQNVDNGLRTDHVLTMRLSLSPDYSNSQKIVGFYDGVLDQVERPGVSRCSYR